jgi:hypothetical protein
MTVMRIQPDVDQLRSACLEILNGKSEDCVVIQLFEGEWRISWDKVSNATVLIGLLERVKYELLGGTIYTTDR